MLPILLSEAVPITTILSILGIKLIIGIISGLVIDFILRLKNKKEEEQKIIDLCEKDHCHCEHGIFMSALKHTLNIFVFIFIITIIINFAIYLIGEEQISSLLQSKPILGPILSGLVGLIPNCASSVILTQMYLENVISISTMISGTLVGAGVGLAVLFKTNQGIKQNIKIVTILYIIGVISGIALELIGFHI